jgi:hypothetical protein
MTEEQITDKKFPPGFSPKERAIFEVGIKLGALYHIAMGIPISRDPIIITSIENALANSIKSQPYVTDVRVKINIAQDLVGKKHPFDYSEIQPSILGAEIHLTYKNIQILGILEWNKQINYPLMYIKDIH